MARHLCPKNRNQQQGQCVPASSYSKVSQGKVGWASCSSEFIQHHWETWCPPLLWEALKYQRQLPDCSPKCCENSCGKWPWFTEVTRIPNQACYCTERGGHCLGSEWPWVLPGLCFNKMCSHARTLSPCPHSQNEGIGQDQWFQRGVGGNEEFPFYFPLPQVIRASERGESNLNET